MRIPVMLAPIGSLHVFTPDGSVATAKAAAKFGTAQVVSSVSEHSPEEIAASTVGPKVFQLYVRGDWAWTEDIIARVKQAGYTALCVTVDSAHPSRRERVRMSDWSPPPTRNSTDQSYQAALTWESIDRIKELAGLPFMIKGVATAEDAALAIEHGVDVIWVSNHGGRQLDHGLGTMDTLLEIVEAVAGRADVVLDGGVQRGGDVLKALALGATAVAIGKLQGWGLAAAGQEGLVRVLEILEDEFVSAMALLGVQSADQITPAHVCEAYAVIAPHEMSAWVNMPETGILNAPRGPSGM
jgi:glycolate oxidase